MGKPQPLPDLVVLESGNKYGVVGLADWFSVWDSTKIQYPCPFANLPPGNATWWQAAASMEGFLEIKVLRPSDGWFWKAYKGGADDPIEGIYGVVGIGLPGTDAPPFTQGGLNVNQYDEYDNFVYVDGAGDYAVQISINDVRRFKEVDYKNNLAYFGFSFGLVSGEWIAIRKDSILTKAVINKLLHQI
jgi:hypothetical protein